MKVFSDVWSFKKIKLVAFFLEIFVDIYFNNQSFADQNCLSDPKNEKHSRKISWNHPIIIKTAQTVYHNLFSKLCMEKFILLSNFLTSTKNCKNLEIFPILLWKYVFFSYLLHSGSEFLVLFQNIDKWKFHRNFVLTCFFKFNK